MDATCESGADRRTERVAELIKSGFCRGSGNAVKYMTGLPGSAERKNGWQQADSSAGDAASCSVQQFLYREFESADRVRDHLREHLKKPPALKTPCPPLTRLDFRSARS